MVLYNWLEKEAIELGWDYFGVADLRPYHDYLATFCGDFIRQFPVAVSLVFKLSDVVVDSILEQEPDKQLSFNNYCYHAVDYFQNTAAVRLSRMIEKEGFKAYPVPASYGVYAEKLAGLVSHKLVANAAGLGWIGKNGLFLTPQDGPRVRLATILIDANLVTGQPMLSKCGTCTICIDKCPAIAIKDINTKDELPNVDIHKCHQYQEERKKAWDIKIDRCICGLCQAICPWGKRD
ncbi:MAG TPA: 4Fe-4S double cluster binding domain-containing protein [Syntrophomonadaceae bacterium]|nr:4Fe-4S double cluster binding domain-containing protein [Syntrophomonadaceae bacterium]